MNGSGAASGSGALRCCVAGALAAANGEAGGADAAPKGDTVFAEAPNGLEEGLPGCVGTALAVAPKGELGAALGGGAARGGAKGEGGGGAAPPL